MQGLRCLVLILRCMVEWSREHYIDPATTGLNAVREFRDGPGPEREGGEGEGEEGEGEEGGRREERASSFMSLRPAAGGEGGGGDGDSSASMDNPEQIESRKLLKETRQQGIHM